MDDRLVPLLRGQGGHQLNGHILPAAQNPQPLLRAFRHLGRVRPQEKGSNGGDFVAPDAEVQGDMMPLDPPAPGFVSGVAGAAEHRPVVKQRVAVPGSRAFLHFQRPQDVLVLHNGRRLLVGVRVEGSRHQRVSQIPLLRVHIPQRQAVAVQRRVIPEKTLPVQVAESSLGLLLRGKALQPPVGGGGHLRRSRGMTMVMGMLLTVGMFQSSRHLTLLAKVWDAVASLSFRDRVVNRLRRRSRNYHLRA